MVSIICSECSEIFEAENRRFKYCDDCKYKVERRKANEQMARWLTDGKRAEYNFNKRDYNRQYARDRAAERAEYKKAWRAENKDVHASHQAKRRAIIKTSQVEDISISEIYELNSGVCWLCSLSVSLNEVHLEHIIPLCRGGTHTKDNVNIAHGKCNSIKSSRLISEIEDLFPNRKQITKGERLKSV